LRRSPRERKGRLDFGASGWPEPFLLLVRLFAGDSPFQTVEAFFGKAAGPKIYPSDLSQEEGELESLGAVR
jgi:hypothetical protein